MRVVVFATESERVRGLQFRKRIEPDTLFVFPDVLEGSLFHSRNVPEPFDIAFLTAEFYVLEMTRVDPPFGVTLAPRGTRIAVEAKEGNLRAWNFVPGRVAFYGAAASEDGVAWRS